MTATIAGEVARVKRELARMARDPGTFDATRYFRADGTLKFFNVRMPRVRALARELARRHADWTLREAMACASQLIRDPHLEAKAVAVELVARYRRQCSPSDLALWKQWLKRGYSNNWATTDSICGFLIGPLLVEQPDLAASVAGWSRDSNMWVRRASAVALIRPVRLGPSLSLAYKVALTLRPDRHDLIHKAVGWLLREAGEEDVERLKRFLRTYGRSLPRTTVRYAIERFPERERKEWLGRTAKHN